MKDEHIRLDCTDARPIDGVRYSLLSLTEDEIADLAAGIVPRVVKAMAAGCLSWRDEDERKAARPERKKRKAG